MKVTHLMDTLEAKGWKVSVNKYSILVQKGDNRLTFQSWGRCLAWAFGHGLLKEEVQQ